MASTFSAAQSAVIGRFLESTALIPDVRVNRGTDRLSIHYDGTEIGVTALPLPGDLVAAELRVFVAARPVLTESDFRLLLSLNADPNPGGAYALDPDANLVCKTWMLLNGRSQVELALTFLALLTSATGFSILRANP